MNWLKKTLGICSLSLTVLFSGPSSANSETLEIVFKNSIWGAAIGGVSGVALWALQEDDKEDKFFPKYPILIRFSENLYLFIFFYCTLISFNTFLIKCNFIGCALVRDRLSIEFEKVFIFS